MLIETPYKEGDVVSIKISSGEEVVGKLTNETEDTITLSKPLMVVMNQQGFGLAPYMFTVSPDAKINLKTKNVICIVKTIDDMAKQYIANTSGIAVAG